MIRQRVDGDKALKLYSEGQTMMARGQYGDAIRFLEGSAKCDPHYKTLELLGECYLEQERFCEAVSALAAATTLSQQPRAAYLLARAFQALGDLRRSREMAELACTRNRRFTPAIRFLEDLET